MASLVLNGNTSGSVTISSPAVSGTTTLTLPTTSGTVLTTASTFAGTGPTFSAYQSSGQTISDAVGTKVTCQTEEWDTNSNYDNATNYRFTPTVAGYYQASGMVSISQTAQSDTTIWIYKNGSGWKRGSGLTATSSKQQLVVSCLVYLNGSTDYIELWVYSDGTGSATTNPSTDSTWFQAFLARAA
jgi:hypothetical protein